MGRGYTVSYTGTLTAAGGDADLLECTPADDKPVVLRGWHICQSTEFGDVAEEELRVSILRMNGGTFTSGNGTSVTPKPCDPSDTAAGFTAECNGATVATTTGTTDTLAELGWNERGTPWTEWWLDDRFAFKARQADTLLVRNQTTVADDITIELTFYIEEL